MADLRAETFDHVKIAVREKPLSDVERGKVQVVLRTDADKLVAFYPEATEGLVYNYDHFYPEESTQADLFQAIGVEMVDLVMGGYSATCIACGPSNSGKTHTIFGSPQEPGLIHLTTKELFQRIEAQDTYFITVKMAYWETSCDAIADALGPNEGKTFALHKSEQYGATLVGGLNVVDVGSWDEFDEFLMHGNIQRITLAEKRDTRWHGFVRLFLEMVPRAAGDSMTSCMMTFVHMKGADRVGQKGARGNVLRNGSSNINKSVSLLGSAILHAVDFRRSAARSTSKNVHLTPLEIAAKSQSFFMESKFTQLLSNALCGNEATYLIATVSTLDYHETTDALETLQNAQQLTAHLAKRTVITEQGKLQQKLSKLQSEAPVTNLAEGHPLSELEEKIRDLERRLGGGGTGYSGDSDDDDAARPKPGKVDVGAAQVPENVQKWKQSVIKAKMHGDRATIYVPAVAGKKHTYTGQWAKGKREGFGEHVTEKMKYEGHWKGGLRDGEGTLWVRNDASAEWVRVYRGQWREDQKHGRGVQWYPNGDVYDGYFQTGERCPFGKLFLANGDRVEGQFRNDDVEGWATLHRKNGDWFEGHWHGGLREGPGVWYYEGKQQLFRGEWHLGTPKFGEMFDMPSKTTNQNSRYLPRVGLADPDQVLARQKVLLDQKREREGMHLDAAADDEGGQEGGDTHAGDAYYDDDQDQYDEDPQERLSWAASAPVK
jgi:hypothetical protein